MTDPFVGILTQMATISGAVWAGTAALAGETGWRPVRISVALGPLFGLVASALGYLQGLPDCAATWMPHWLCRDLSGLFAGLVCTLVAKVFHDTVASPVLGMLTRATGAPPDPPPPAAGSTP